MRGTRAAPGGCLSLRSHPCAASEIRTRVGCEPSNDPTTRRSTWNAPATPAPGSPDLTASSAEASDLRALLRTGIAELDLPHETAETLAEDLARLAELLAEWAPRVGLTAHRTPQAIARRLILDGLALSTVLPEATELADLGTGAGFPGLPLALLGRGRPVSLVESREKRQHFLRAAVRTLALENVRLIHGRAEVLPPQPHGLVVAQAMGPPQQVAQWMLPWAAAGAWLAIPSSVPAPSFEPPPGVVPVAPRRYRVPLGGPDRELWLAQAGVD